MEGRRQAEEMSRAADRFADAARELAATMDRFMEYQQQLWRQYERQPMVWEPEEYRYRAKLTEEEAVALALEEVHAVREETAQDAEQGERLPPPNPNEVKEWERRREERRQREDQ